MNERVTLSEAFEILAGYGPAVWLGVLAAIATFIIEVVLCTKGILFAGGEQKLKRAKKDGKNPDIHHPGSGGFCCHDGAGVPSLISRGL